MITPGRELVSFKGGNRETGSERKCQMLQTAPCLSVKHFVSH